MERKTIIVVEPNSEPKITTISDTYGIIENLLGGYIDEYPVFREHHLDNIYLCCNEEGLLNNLPVNRTVQQGLTIRGTFVIVKKSLNGTSSSLTEEEVNIINLILTKK